jgi:hypothetical protein
MPDTCDQGWDALGNADDDARRAERAVSFEVELADGAAGAASAAPPAP